MNSAPASPPIYSPARLDYFLRSDSETLRDWLVKHSLPASWFCTGAIIVGAGAYGAAVGSWREGWQGLHRHQGSAGHSANPWELLRNRLGSRKTPAPGA